MPLKKQKANKRRQVARPYHGVTAKKRELPYFFPVAPTHDDSGPVSFVMSVNASQLCDIKFRRAQLECDVMSIDSDESVATSIGRHEKKKVAAFIAGIGHATTSKRLERRLPEGLAENNASPRNCKTFSSTQILAQQPQQQQQQILAQLKQQQHQDPCLL
jgi:hypothetical protein